MISPYRILQLSDIHFGSQYYYVDQGAVPDPRAWARRCADEVEQGLDRYRATQSHPGNQFDLVVLSGDLTCHCEDKGFAAAYELTVEIQTRWWGARKLLILPGNHDIAFGAPPPKFQSSPRIVIPQMKETREKPYRETYEQMSGAPLPEQPWLGLVILDHEHRMAILGLDSCRVEGWSNPGLGYIGYDQLLSMGEAICANCDSKDGELWRRLAFTHHHLLIMGSVNPATARNLQWERRFTLTLDAESVLDGLQEFEVDFISHGHFHTPALHVDRNQGMRHGRVFAAGSTSVTATDCNHQHQFFIYEIFEGVDPILKVYDFRRDLNGGAPQPWTCPRPFEFRLPPRSPCTLGHSGPQVRRVKESEAKSFLLAYDSWPLALAFLTPGRIPNYNEYVELYVRMDAAWERIRRSRPNLPPMIDVMVYVNPYLQRYREALREEFGKRLDNEEEAVSFEDFVIEKVMLDPRFEAL